MLKWAYKDFVKWAALKSPHFVLVAIEMDASLLVSSQAGVALDVLHYIDIPRKGHPPQRSFLLAIRKFDLMPLTAFRAKPLKTKIASSIKISNYPQDTLLTFIELEPIPEWV